MILFWFRDDISKGLRCILRYKLLRPHMPRVITVKILVSFLYLHKMRETRQIEKQFELVTAIKANNENALKQLYTQNFKKVEHYILTNSGSVHQAKDTYQEAFIVLWRNIKTGKFEPKNETALQGYLYQIAKNKWIDFLRSSQFRKTDSLPDNLEEADDMAPVDNQPKEKNLSKVMSAFKQLGNPCKELLTHFYFGKKSVREIANTLQIEEASVRNKKYRCMQKLKELAISQN